MTAHASSSDGRAGTVSPARVMLHHLVFSNAGARLGDGRTACDRSVLFDSLNEVPASASRRRVRRGARRRAPAARLRLPDQATDRWVGTGADEPPRHTQTVYLEYRATVVTGEALKPAYPVWLDVGGCGWTDLRRAGAGRRGSTYSQSTTVPAPFTGRIVAALGHLHGGRQRAPCCPSGLRRPRAAALVADVGRPALAALPHPARPARAQPDRHGTVTSSRVSVTRASR